MKALGPALAITAAIGGIVLLVDAVNAAVTGNSLFVELFKSFWPATVMTIGSFSGGEIIA